jgi:hypothetical protein
MDSQLLIELIGYAASALVALSLTLKNILRLRLVNLVGAFFFTLYGLALGAYPIVITNLIIIGINLYFIWQLLTASTYFRLLPVDPHSSYLASFLDFYAADIARFFPDFAYQASEAAKVILILRNMQPTGVLIGHQNGPDFMIELDYVIEGYRDFKSGQYVFRDSRQMFTDWGVRSLIATGRTPPHVRYLKRIGFQEISSQPARYRLDLNDTSQS